MNEVSELEQLKQMLADDWKAFVWGVVEGWEKVTRVEDRSGRWYTDMTTIIRGPSGQLYAFSWEEGLTEYQENECPDPRPRRVRAVTRTIEVTEYLAVGE